MVLVSVFGVDGSFVGDGGHVVLGKGLLGVAHPIKAESCGVFSKACCLLLGRPRVFVERKGDLVLGLVSSRVEHVTGEGN